MTALDPLDRELLYFICSCAHHRVRVVRIKARRGASLQRLRCAGLVSPHGFQPSQRALAEWLERHETPVPRDSKGPAEPPAPEAVAEGDGAARNAGAPSPNGLEEQRNTRGTSGAHGRGLERAPESGLSNGPISQRKRRTPDTAASTPIAPPPAYSPEKQNFLSGQAARLRAGRERAAAFLDSGKTSVDATSVTLRIEARKLEVWRAEEARRNDPIEQAKTMIRCKTRHAVFGAEVTLGDAGKGKFFIGNKLVSKVELLAMAARFAA